MIPVVLAVLGLVLLIAGAETLVRGAGSAARRFGLCPLVIGLTIVAFGTSAPELVVSMNGALRGYGDIAVGNVVGSNIVNVGAILGVAALISPIRIEFGLIRLHAPLLIVVSLIAVGLVSTDRLTRQIGIALVLSLVVYTALSVRQARKQAVVNVEREFEAGVPHPTSSPWLDALLIVAGLALLAAGSHVLVRSAAEIARSFGISDAVIGLTIVAAGTSAPEFATSVVAAIRGQSDIAVGNIIGSNIFNILGILGMVSIVTPLSSPGIRLFDLWVMVGYSVALLPLIWTGRKLQRWEGALLLAGYSLYLWALWPR